MSLVKEVAGTLNLEHEGLSRPQSSHHAPACTKEYGGSRCRLYICRSGTQTVVQMGLLLFYFYFAVCHLKILPPSHASSLGVFVTTGTGASGLGHRAGSLVWCPLILTHTCRVHDPWFLLRTKRLRACN